MQRLKFLSVVIFLISISQASHAIRKVHCWAGDCLANGWTASDALSGKFTDYQCYRDGCRKSGWIVGGTEKISYYTQCIDEDCFKNGWYEVDRSTQELIKTIRCQKGSCLEFGWSVHMKNSTNSTSSVECLLGSCSTQGWREIGSNFVNQSVCLRNDCFHLGWIEK